jgi:hypothetical protein
MILSHDLQACPEQEITAVLYAQHWAETDGHPAAEVRQSLENQYGGDQAARIDLILRLMRAANLLGNTFDLVLFRISFGAWGR